MTTRMGAPALFFEVDPSLSPRDGAGDGSAEACAPPSGDADTTEECDFSIWGLDCFEVDCP